MVLSNVTRCFLGANSKTGFYSLYDGFTDPAAGNFLFVIKGVPGCGKSSFMKRIGAAAEAAGLAVEYVHCSGDPDSLDAVYLPAKHLAWVDGTAPHVLEPPCSGAAGRYLDFSGFLDTASLRQHLPEMIDITNRYKTLYGMAYAQLAAAAALLPGNQPRPCVTPSVVKRMEGIARRELKNQKKPPTVTHRFLSAWTCRGRVCFTETLTALCDKLYLLDNGLGLGHAALAQLADEAAARGYDAVVCHDPLEPEKLEALLLPEARLGFLASEPGESLPPLPCRRLRLDAPILRALTPEEKSALRQRRKECRALLAAAIDTLARAKSLHDELEAVYRPHVDFTAVDALAEEHIRLALA